MGSGTSSSTSPRGFRYECTSPQGLHCTRRISSSYFEMITWVVSALHLGQWASTSAPTSSTSSSKMNSSIGMALFTGTAVSCPIRLSGNHLAYRSRASKQKGYDHDHSLRFMASANFCYAAGVKQATPREALIERAQVLVELGRAADALAVVGRLYAINPSDPDGLEIEGLCRLQLGEPTEALKVLGRAIAERPERSHA